MSSVSPYSPSERTPGDGTTALLDALVEGAHVPPDPSLWPSPLAPQVFNLSAVETSTICVTPPRGDQIVFGLGDLTEAMARLHIFGLRRVLPWASAHYLAQQLQYSIGNPHPQAIRRAHEGWLLLGSLADLELVEMTVSAEPLPENSRTWRPMPLRERLAELARDETPLT